MPNGILTAQFSRELNCIQLTSSVSLSSFSHPIALFEINTIRGKPVTRNLLDFFTRLFIFLSLLYVGKAILFVCDIFRGCACAKF